MLPYLPFLFLLATISTGFACSIITLLRHTEWDGDDWSSIYMALFNVVNMGNDFVRTVMVALDRMTAPIYNPIRRVMPDLGALDLSPMVVLLAIIIIRHAILPPLFGLV